MIFEAAAPFGIVAGIHHEKTRAENEAWEKRARAHLPHAHPKRIAEWAIARAALEEAFRSAGIKLNPDATRFVGHHEIAGLGDWRFSLSHTESIAVAWLARTVDCVNLGLDVESEKREPHPRTRARIEAAGDVSRLTTLQLWSLKEAAYKALPPEGQEVHHFDRIAILDEGSVAYRASGRQGAWSQTVRDGYLLSFAWLVD